MNDYEGNELIPKRIMWQKTWNVRRERDQFWLSTIVVLLFSSIVFIDYLQLCPKSVVNVS